MTYNIEEGKHYVYVLRDTSNSIIYVGETEHPRQRFNQHVSSTGKFAGRRDELKLLIVSEHDSRKEAIQAEGEYKTGLGLEWDEQKHWQSQGRKKAMFQPSQVINMKSMFYSEGYTQSEIAKYYGVTQSAISRILNNKNYNYDV